MTQPALSSVLRYVRSLVGVPQAGDLSDFALLCRFAQQHDEAALVTVLQRHGPLVLATCRQVVRDEHAAEDAFQATFLVLARKAFSLRVRGSLAPWLHQIAYRAALKIRVAALRRRTREEQAMPLPTRNHDDQDRADWLPVLHEEVSRLPEKYRTPVILCYLQGHSYPETAAALGWPEGTVGGRLARARALLQRRLARRGIALAVGALAVTGQEGLAAVPPSLLDATARAAGDFAAGSAPASSGAAAVAASLLHGMAWGRWKLLIHFCKRLGLT